MNSLILFLQRALPYSWNLRIDSLLLEAQGTLLLLGIEEGSKIRSGHFQRRCRGNEPGGPFLTGLAWIGHRARWSGKVPYQ